MKKTRSSRISVFFLSMIVAFSLLIPNTAYAEDSPDTQPAPSKKLYEFDGVQYVNVGNNSFSTSQQGYYRAMLENALNSGKYSSYCISDLWTTIGMEMLARYNGSGQIQNNLFRKEKEYFLYGENDLDGTILRDVYAAPLSRQEYEPSTSRSIRVRHTFGDSMIDTRDIDFNFFRFSLRSAATSQTFAESVARLTSLMVVDQDGQNLDISDSIPVKINENMVPELNGPVYFSIVGASGKDLHIYNQQPYNENNIHAAVVAFSDFSITPIIPDENESAPYAYVKAGGGSSSKDEQKIVSDVKNYSGETISASQTISESVSSTITSSISGSKGTSTTDSYGISDTVKVGAKFTLEKIFEFSEEISSTTSEEHSTTETVSKGWSSSEGTTQSETNSRTITVPLPPYTTALMSQQHFNSEELVRYSCPVALNYKVTVYYAYGKLINGDKEVEISFEKLTDFGSSSNAISELGKRYTQSTESSMMSDVDGIDWWRFSNDCHDLISVLSHTATFDTTQATFTSKVNLVRTEVDDILPIYSINAIKFVNPDSVMHNNPWLTEISMEVGDTDNANNYSLRALNQYGADFYTFYRQNGNFILLDNNKNDITETGNDVVKPEIDTVTGSLRFKAVGEGTVYLSYKIKDGMYKTADMAASNTPVDFIDNNEIPHPALLRINVTDTGHKHTWLKPKYVWADDYSTCTAYCRCKYDDTHIKQETSDSESCTNGGIIEYTAEFETEGFEPQTTTVTIAKKANPLKIAAKTATIKYSKLKKKTQNLAVTKVIRFTRNAKDKKNYTLSSAKKGTKSYKKYFRISKTTGKVTVKKGLKKGTYKVKVKVKALGNSTYKASAVKTVTFTVKVR